MSVGTVISGKYEIQREIKRGGFGIIYQGLDTNFGKAVAIKAIDPELLGEAKYVDMFQQEAMNVARLNHQNIVQVYDIRRAETGQIYIIMEYIDGFDLMRVLRACRKNNQQLPAHLAAHIISEICSGLNYAHNRRDPETKEPLHLIHKDVSPANIMLTRSGEVKIIDFGMANFLNSHERKFNEVQIQGNIRYLAPEQARQADIIDRRADIFALGVVLFEILTGERLIRCNTTQEIVETLIVGSYDLSRLEKNEIPEKLQQITCKALQHNPADRYPSANDMYRDLMHHLILTAPTANFMSELISFIEAVDPDSIEEDEIELPGAPETEKTPAGVVDPLETATEDNLVPAQETVAEPPETEPQPAEQGHFEEEAEPASSQEQTDVSDDLSPHDNQAEQDEQQEPPQEPVEPDFVETATEPESTSSYYSFVEEDDDDNQRTIIDVVRLSARAHQKSIIVGVLTLFVSFLSFTVVDTFANLTPFGTGIYDFLFPPAIRIVSVPSDANVYLDDQLLSQTTPLSLDEISPGVHKLMLTLPQYESIVKSINVPRKGELRLSGEAKRHANQPYVLRFKSRLDLTSQPDGAKIIIDGISLNQTTPATVFWDVSDQPAHIELELSGLPKLTGLGINSLTGKETIVDRRFWKVSRPIAGKAHYLLEGVFHKSITISSKPRLADIYYNDSEKPVGVTGISGNMMLTIGKHRFTLRKEGYLARNFMITVDEKTRSAVHRDLSRLVRIFAKDALSGVDRDLGAKVVSLTLNNKAKTYNKRTPAVVELLPYTYTALLRRSSYHDTEIEITPQDKSVVAKMRPLYYELTVEAIDAITSAPINTARISYRPEASTAPEQILGITDASGKINGKLIPGVYEVTVSKGGYQMQRKSITLRPEKMNRLTFRLTALR